MHTGSTRGRHYSQAVTQTLIVFLAASSLFASAQAFKGANTALKPDPYAKIQKKEPLKLNKAQVQELISSHRCVALQLVGHVPLPS